MQRRARAVRTVIVAVAVLALGACGSGDPGMSPGQVDAPGPAADRPLQAPPQVAGWHTDEDFDNATPLPVPSWDKASRANALSTAAGVMCVFARPGVDARTWWVELEPLLTPAAAVAYEGTDPANIPASSVTGEPMLLDVSSPYLARVGVPTNVGDYEVLLVRGGAGSEWQVERLTPLAVVGP